MNQCLSAYILDPTIVFTHSYRGLCQRPRSESLFVELMNSMMRSTSWALYWVMIVWTYLERVGFPWINFFRLLKNISTGFKKGEYYGLYMSVAFIESMLSYSIEFLCIDALSISKMTGLPWNLSWVRTYSSILKTKCSYTEVSTPPSITWFAMTSPWLTAEIRLNENFSCLLRRMFFYRCFASLPPSPSISW